MTSRILLAILGTTILPASAWAHPGHVVEAGGHTHWLAIAILGGLGIGLAAFGLIRLLRASKRQRRA